ncbi:MAG: VOC family protein [Bacteroidia bacterium]|nr:VOC family protein [Bacteroidia bacterium]
MAKVTGIGGVFIKCNDVENAKNWYQKHLGFNTDTYGTTFQWLTTDSKKIGHTQWSVFKKDSSYFAPSTKPFMINFRVDDLVALREKLINEGVTVLDEIETFEYGKFMHILDLENNKIELWEPIDEVYHQICQVFTP